VNKLILFGAGKIGRSFIGQLFSLGGYEVVFIDIDRRIIDALNERRSYDVIIKSESGDEIIPIKNVRGILSTDEDQIDEELSDCNLVATSVGQTNLNKIIPLIAQGILKKYHKGNTTPTDIILAENLRNAARYTQTELAEILPSEFPLGKMVGLVETSIGKMVPIMSVREVEEDVLKVYAEPYNTLILDKKGFRNTLPDVPGLAPKENMKAWVDRKSFIHNLGHASAAYYGTILYPNAVYMWEILEDREVYQFTRKVMVQSAHALMAEYPGEFSFQDLEDHIDDLIARFRNKALGDTVFRVGLDLYRKLGPQDRLVGAIRFALKHGLSYDLILRSILNGFKFKATDENGDLYLEDKKFHNNTRELKMDEMLEQICGFDTNTDSEVFKLAETINRNYN